MAVIALPYAGAGAAAFRELAVRLGSSVELWALQPPGRWGRPNEPAIEALEELVPHVGHSLADLVTLPYVLLGYSFGGLVAYEVVRWLQARDLPLPRELVACAALAPHFARETPPLHELPEQELLEQVSLRYRAFPKQLLEEPAMRRLIIGGLRADLKCLETYRHQPPSAPLTLPITAICGEQDGVVSKRAVAAWAELTTGDFDLVELSGGHFFLHEQGQVFCQTLEGVIERQRLALQQR